MSKQHRPRSNWQNALGGLAICCGFWGLMSTEAQASSKFSLTGFKLAQISIQQGPTPLNLRSRVHIPLPSSNRRHFHRRSRRSSGRLYRQDRHRDVHYDHHRDDYGYYDDYHHGRRHRKNRKQRRGPVIIINPHGSSIYHHNNSFIRVFHK